MLSIQICLPHSDVECFTFYENVKFMQIYVVLVRGCSESMTNDANCGLSRVAEILLEIR
jgi:hypothetical protein